ncbi:MAG: hypothetical protein ABDH23_03095 [Endomicrobiia bacterium]
MKNIKGFLLIKYIFLFLIFSCSSPDRLLKSAIEDEKKNRYDKAEQKYLTLIVKFPHSRDVVEAKYRLGLIYKDIMKDYAQAIMWFSDIIKNHQDSEFYKPAEVGILESPDYIGALDNNSVILGDVETGGKNMKIVNEFDKIDFDLYKCICKLYAGEKLVRQEIKFYLKTSQEIREYDVNPKMSKEKNLKYSIVFRLPVEAGTKWVTKKEDKEVIYTIVAKDIRVKLKNHEFNNCVKILETYKGQEGIRYLYYAAGKGCIKIATSSVKKPNQEFSVLELIE